MSVIDDVFKTLPAPQAAELERIRAIVRKAVPEAEEVISYGIPAFKYEGHYLVGFAAYRNHLSLFPGAAPIIALKDKLGAYKLSAGTIQFTLEKPLPEALIKEIIAVRMAALR